jgi:tRNA threonylcarbamoyladenosine biosynthesis protein TsaE
LDDFISLGLLEELEKEGIHFVEWGDDTLEKLLENVGMDNIKVKIFIKNDKREYYINA